MFGLTGIRWWRAASFTITWPIMWRGQSPGNNKLKAYALLCSDHRSAVSRSSNGLCIINTYNCKICRQKTPYLKSAWFNDKLLGISGTPGFMTAYFKVGKSWLKDGAHLCFAPVSNTGSMGTIVIISIIGAWEDADGPTTQGVEPWTIWSIVWTTEVDGFQELWHSEKYRWVCMAEPAM